MPRYIDAERLDCISWKGIPEGYDDTFDSGVLWMADLIDDQPTVSPDEVRGEGEWYRPSGMMPPEHTGKHRCSNCNSFAMRGWKSVREELTNYCPNCGAKMGVSEDA